MIRHLIPLLFAAHALAFGAEQMPKKPGKFCWPMHYAGIIAGTSQDKHVVRLLGHGAHRPNESDGVRYYIDPRGKMTMKVSTFTFGTVGELSLESGVASTLSRSERTRAVSRFLDSNEGFGNWHALRLGSTQEEVRKNLGEPVETQGPDAWVFNAECTCELPQYITVHFEHGKIRRVIFSAPPG